MYSRGTVDVGGDGVGQRCDAAVGGQGLRSGEVGVDLAVSRLEALARCLPLGHGVRGSDEAGHAGAALAGRDFVVSLHESEARRQLVEQVGAHDVGPHGQQLLDSEHCEEDGEGRALLHGRLLLPFPCDE